MGRKESNQTNIIIYLVIRVELQSACLKALIIWLQKEWSDQGLHCYTAEADRWKK